MIFANSTPTPFSSVAALAERSGLGRESLYKTLAPGSKPRYETIRKLVDV